MQIKIALLASAVLARAHWTTMITPPSVTAVPNAGPATSDENITHGGLDWSSTDADNSASNQPESFVATHGLNQGSGGLLGSLENLLGGDNSNGLLSGLLGDGNHDGLLAALLGPDGLLTNLLGGGTHRNGLLSGLLGSDGNGITGLLKKLLDELTGPTAGPATPDRTAVIQALQALTQADGPNATNPAGNSPNPAGGQQPSPNGSPLPDLASYDDSSCSTGSRISCCDTSGKTEGALANILGGSCDLPQLLFSHSNCAADEVFCCPTDQDGFLNLSASCVPITL